MVSIRGKFYFILTNWKILNFNQHNEIRFYTCIKVIHVEQSREYAYDYSSLINVTQYGDDVLLRTDRKFKQAVKAYHIHFRMSDRVFQATSEQENMLIGCYLNGKMVIERVNRQNIQRLCGISSTNHNAIYISCSTAHPCA